MKKWPASVETTIKAVTLRLEQGYRRDPNIIHEFRRTLPGTIDGIEVKDSDLIQMLATMSITLPAHRELDPDIAHTPRYRTALDTIRRLTDA